MTLIQLEYIVAVDTYKNFALAAEKSFVTQPTLSMQIQKLEEGLGILIFDRSKHPTIATEAGAELIEQARKVLKEAAKIKELISDKKTEIKGELRIGIIPTAAPYLLPLFLTKFLKKYPDVKLIVDELTTDQIVANLRNDMLDAGILVTPLHNSHITELPLYYEPFVVYASEKSNLSNVEKLKPKEINLNEVWLMNEEHCISSQVMNLCNERKKQHIVTNLEYKAGSIETLKKMVELNNGVTLLPALSLTNLTPAQKKMVKYFEAPVPVREVSLVISRTFIKKRMIEALKESILSHIPESMKKAENRKIVQI